VRKTKSHIVGACILIAGLLFSQVVINLFHDRHDFHESISTKAESIQTHNEHCKVCSIDVLINLELIQSTEFRDSDHCTIANSFSPNFENFAFIALSEGRAPPIQR
jgi:hypothetical protein